MIMHEGDYTRIKSNSPKKVNSAVRRLLLELALPENNAVWLKYKIPNGFTSEPGNCHFNVWVQCEYSGGKPIYGWIISQDVGNDFIEAQFHCVWSDLDGVIFDITPRLDSEKRIMFVLDTVRTVERSEYNGAPALISYDNVRIHRGKVVSGLQRIKIVPQTDFMYKHGLAILR